MLYWYYAVPWHLFSYCPDHEWYWIPYITDSGQVHCHRLNWGHQVLTRWGRDKMAATLADDTFKYKFFNENVLISIKISLRFVPKGPINNILALVQKMAWRRPGDKALYEPMMFSLLMHICITQWVKNFMRSCWSFRLISSDQWKLIQDNYDNDDDNGNNDDDTNNNNNDNNYSCMIL